MTIQDEKNSYENESNETSEVIELISTDSTDEHSNTKEQNVTVQQDDTVESRQQDDTIELEKQDDTSELERQDDTSELEEQNDVVELEEMADLELDKNSHTKTPKTIKVKTIVIRTVVSFVTIILLLFFTLFGCVMIINYGPSETARNLFVNSVMESSAGKFLATSFFSDEKISQIRAQNSVVASAEVTDSNLIQIDSSAEETQKEVDPIELIDISASTYKGKLVIVHDPSRLTVGVSGNYGASCSGRTVKDMAVAYNAVVAVNAGGFIDEGGMGNGGTPIGIVISEGKLKFGSLSTTYEIIGFDNQNKLVVGKMTGQQALDRGIRDAVSFGPILIVNGTPSVVNGSGSGWNPRTAIGQRADGAILLLVIDGRQANSLGATYADLVQIMLQYGAENAANLDGGSSSLLYYNGEYINNCSSLYGPRNLPTSIIVR